jgi:hypothetical protein
MLRQEHAVSVFGPTWAGPSDIRWTEAFGQAPLFPSLPDVLDEPTHGRSIARRPCLGPWCASGGITVVVVARSAAEADVRRETSLSV